MARPNKRPKVHVMSASGQTDAERRALRQSQRTLQKKITSNEGQSMEDPDSAAFDEIRHDNNALWDKVRYTREAVLDGDNLEAISHRATRQVDRLIQVPRYDAVRLARKLKEKCGAGGNFDWNVLGREAGACFNALPSGVSFLHGPVDNEYKPKERKKPERRARQQEEEDEDEEEDEAAQAKEKNGPAAADKLSAVEQSMKVISKTLSKRCKEEEISKMKAVEESASGPMDKETKEKYIKNIKKEGICAVKYMFNPKSFTQTVENIFHFSFLVKKGAAGIKVVKDDNGHCRPMVRATARADKQPEARQTIVALSMKDWRNMVHAYNVENCDIPHRTGSRHAPPSSSKRRST